VGAKYIFYGVLYNSMNSTESYTKIGETQSKCGRDQMSFVFIITTSKFVRYVLVGGMLKCIIFF